LVTWETGVAGSYEYWEYAPTCKEAAPDSQLPDCKAYMDASYNPYFEMWDSATPFFEEAETEGGYSNRLQMLTGIFAVSLFLLGVTSPMKKRKNAAYLIAFAATLWATGVAILASIPIIIL